MAMNMNEIKTTAREMTINALHDVLNFNSAVQFADNSFAILQNVGDQEVWTEVTVKSKAFKATKRYEAFDPYEEAEAWKEEKRISAEKKAEKAAAKAKKIAKDAEKRAAKEKEKEGE